MYSSTLADFYDSFMGDYSSLFNVLMPLIRNFVPAKSSVLELGCGTGNILAQLQLEYTVSGLDNSKDMLKIAQNKLPKTKLYEADIRSFELNTNFQAIICVYDTINHLLRFEDWQRVFRRVAIHLEKGGLFILDMNTISRLERIAAAPATVLKLDKNTLVCIKGVKLSRRRYAARFQMLENILSDSIGYTEELVAETSFELEKVYQSLEKWFVIEKKIDMNNNIPREDGGRVFIVCRRRE